MPATSPPVNGQYVENIPGDNFTELRLEEKVTLSEGANGVRLAATVPALSEIVYGFTALVNQVTVAGTANDGTNTNTANNLLVVLSTATAATSVSTATSNYVIYHGTTLTAGSRNAGAFQSARYYNDSTSPLNVWLFPAVNSTQGPRLSVATNTNGYKFFGTDTSGTRSASANVSIFLRQLKLPVAV